jgi:predicted DNA-binding protein
MRLTKEKKERLQSLKSAAGEAKSKLIRIECEVAEISITSAKKLSAAIAKLEAWQNS